MELRSSKEIEQGGRMRRHLEVFGFERAADGDMLNQERWELREGEVLKAGVVITRVASMHDPIEAEVWTPGFKPDVVLCYNAKGLHDVLAARVSKGGE